jgi:hypothetical protein
MFGTALASVLKRSGRQLEKLKLPEPVADLDATPPFKRKFIAVRTN